MTRSARHADVAVYAPLAGALYGVESRPIGGAELQSGYLCRALVEQGLRVRHLVAGRDLPRHRDGLEVLTLPAEYSARGLARRKAIVQALREADARLYIQRSAGFETLVVGLFARALRRRFVFSSSSLADFSRDPQVAARAGASLDEWPTRMQYLAGLRLADAVVVQTKEQRNLAWEQRGVEATVIRSFCPVVTVKSQIRGAFLWIGGFVDSKDPLSYVELARRVADAQFWMIGTDRGKAWTKLAAEVREQAGEVPNLDLLPPVGREEVLLLYDRAVAVVNTSWFEGFPNTLLEGWARGTPALSLRTDPDSVIERHRLGIVCHGSFDKLEAGARLLWERGESCDPAPFQEYVARVHDPAVMGRQWAELVRELLDDRQPGRTPRARKG